MPKNLNSVLAQKESAFKKTKKENQPPKQKVSRQNFSPRTAKNSSPGSPLHNKSSSQKSSKFHTLNIKNLNININVNQTQKPRTVGKSQEKKIKISGAGLVFAAANPSLHSFSNYKKLISEKISGEAGKLNFCFSPANQNFLSLPQNIIHESPKNFKSSSNKRGKATNCKMQEPDDSHKSGKARSSRQIKENNLIFRFGRKASHQPFSHDFQTLPQNKFDADKLRLLHKHESQKINFFQNSHKKKSTSNHLSENKNIANRIFTDKNSDPKLSQKRNRLFCHEPEPNHAYKSPRPTSKPAVENVKKYNSSELKRGLQNPENPTHPEKPKPLKNNFLFQSNKIFFTAVSNQLSSTIRKNSFNFRRPESNIGPVTAPSKPTGLS